MGKPRMDLLKGIEEQENAIENSKAYQEEEAFLNLLRQGKSRKEAYEAIGREKTWASKTIKKIRETEPERLRGTAEEIKDEAHTDQPDTQQNAERKDETEKITVTIMESEKQEQQTIPIKIIEAPQNPQEAPKQIQLIKSTPAEERAEEKANTKPQKQSFSFRADQSKIESWKLYAETIGTKDIGTLWSAAIDEYISNHALTADQQAIYDLKKKAAEMAKKQR